MIRMETDLIGLMNNTKWWKLITGLSEFSVYLQLQRLEDQDFHIDYEQANWILSEINTNSFVYVNRKIEYKSIYALRICKSVIPENSDADIINRAIEHSKGVGKIQTHEDQDFFVIYGYQPTVIQR